MDDELDEKDERIVSLERENERLKASIASLEAQVAGMVAALKSVVIVDGGVLAVRRGPDDTSVLMTHEAYEQACATLSDADAAGKRVIEEATAKGWRAAHDAAVRNYGGAIADAVRAERMRLRKLIDDCPADSDGVVIDNGRLISWRTWLCRSFDTPPAESAGRKVADDAYARGHLDGRLEGAREVAAEIGAPHDGECVMEVAEAVSQMLNRKDAEAARVERERQDKDAATLLNRMATEASDGGFHNCGWGDIIRRELRKLGAEAEEVRDFDTPPAESAEEAECSICNQVGGPLVECTVCHMPKHPRGRDPGLYASSGYCQHECPGHDQEPIPGSLWPNERYGDSLGHMDWHEEADTP